MIPHDYATPEQRMGPHRPARLTWWLAAALFVALFATVMTNVRAREERAAIESACSAEIARLRALYLIHREASNEVCNESFGVVLCARTIYTIN